MWTPGSLKHFSLTNFSAEVHLAPPDLAETSRLTDLCIFSRHTDVYFSRTFRKNKTPATFICFIVFFKTWSHYRSSEECVQHRWWTARTGQVSLTLTWSQISLLDRTEPITVGLSRKTWTPACCSRLFLWIQSLFKISILWETSLLAALI